jgi:biopolymer transport protein TolR
MANVSRGSSMRGGRARRSMADINVVPYIDVMLVLLVIFMVTAPLVTPGNIDLPSVAKSSIAPSQPIEIIIKADKSVTVRVRDNQNPVDERSMNNDELVAFVEQRQNASPNSSNPVPVVISADKKVEYDAVLQVMDALQKKGIKRVGLAVKPAVN